MVELGFKKQFFSSILSTKDKSPIKSRLEKNLTGVLWGSTSLGEGGGEHEAARKEDERPEGYD